MTTDPLADALAELRASKILEDERVLLSGIKVQTILDVLRAAASGDLMLRSDHLAAMAAANEAAAKAIDDDGEYVRAIKLSNRVRALTTADQQAALDRVKREARVVIDAGVDRAIDAMEANMRADGQKTIAWRTEMPPEDQAKLRACVRAGIHAALADGEPT